MSEVKVCCKNCNAHSHRWCLYDKWKNIMSEEEMGQERKCEKFSPTRAALVKEADGKICFIVDDDFIKELEMYEKD